MKTTSLLVLFAIAAIPAAVVAQCSMCLNGGNMTLPEKEISLPGFEFVQTCGQLEGWLPFLPPEGTECGLVQSIGTLCGCDRSPTACDLCGPDTTGSLSIANPDLEMPFLAFLFDGVVPTCALAQAYLNSFHDTDDFCLLSHALLAGYCGCRSSSSATYDATAPSCTMCDNGGGAIPDRNQTLSIPGFPFETCGQLEDAVHFVIKEDTEECDLVHKVSSQLCGCAPLANPCTLCSDGSSITVPEKEAHFARDILFGIVPTCRVVQAYAFGHDADSDFCDLAQRAGSFCGCPSLENHCVYCPEGFPEEFNRIDPSIISLDPDLNIEPTCELIEATQYGSSDTSGTCVLGKLAAFLCGCGGGEFNYAGADSDSKRDTLTWISRAMSILTLLGTLCIQYDVLSHPRKRTHVYNRLVLVMSFFDGCTAFGLLVGPAAMPEENFMGTPLGYPGSYGTRATCKMQGFVIELGITSIYYTISLSLYYMLTIAKGWREDRLKRNQKWFHGVPLTLGVISACAGIPFYDITPFGCHLHPVPVKETLPWMIPLAYAPVIITIIILATGMTYIYCKVLAQDKKANKWRMDKYDMQRMRQSAKEVPTNIRNRAASLYKKTKRKKSKKSKLVEQVYWQGVSYVCSFLISWPILAVGFLSSDQWAVSNFPFWVAFSFCIPLQGLNNAFTYFRPRWAHRYGLWKKRRQEAAKKKRDNIQSQSTNVTGVSTELVDATADAEPAVVLEPTTSRRRFSLIPPLRRQHSAGTEYTSKRALRELRDEDPSAYIAVAGLSSCSSNSERSMTESTTAAAYGEEINLEGLGVIAEVGGSSFLVGLQNSMVSNGGSMNESMLVASTNQASSMSLNENPSPPPSEDDDNEGVNGNNEGVFEAQQTTRSLQQQQQRSTRRVSFMEEQKVEEASTDP